MPKWDILDNFQTMCIEWNFILDKDSLQILENLKMGNLYFTLLYYLCLTGKSYKCTTVHVKIDDIAY